MTILKQVFTTALAAFAFATGAPAFAAPLVTDDAALQFSIGANPNGNWVYGYQNSLASAFVLYNHSWSSAVSGGIWTGWDSGGQPAIFKNVSSTPAQSACCNPLPPGGMAAHPGSAGQVSVLRWIAPSAGSYTVSAWFAGGDWAGTSTDVHVQHNSSYLFNASVNGGLGADIESYGGVLALLAGDFLDFEVGYGTGGYWSDTTRFNATVSSVAESVPEPGSLALLAIGLIALGCRRRLPTA